VLQIGKTPIVVNDSRGFYTSRVFGTYVMEGIAMLKEGVHPRSIEVAGQQAGMPMPPLALQDEVSLSLGLHVADQTKKDLAAEGKPYTEHPGMAVVRQLCEIGRIGKKAGKGFYDWGDDGKQLWPELTKLFPVAAEQPRSGADRPPDVRAGQRGRALPGRRGAALGGRRQHRLHLRLGLCALPGRRAAVHQRHGRQGLRGAGARTGGEARRALRARGQPGEAGGDQRARGLTRGAATMPRMTATDTVRAELARAAGRPGGLAVLTGAGMSAESGIPTFRDAMSGLWSRFDPAQLASEDGFRANPARVWQWYAERRHGVLTTPSPTPATGRWPTSSAAIPA
jgi:hypothetical protein